MIHSRNPRRTQDEGRRTAFTLIELLVVIAIIATLVAMVAAAVLASIRQVSVTETRNDMAQFDNAMSAAKTNLGSVDVLPSTIVLCRTASEYTAAQESSKTALYKMFGRRLWSAGPVQWSSVGNGPWILGPDKSLVFWLGGIPSPTGGCTGFSSDPANPASSSGTRKGPFFEFKATRLAYDSSDGFYRYYDAHGTNMPYLYFSSGRAGNDYDTTASFGVTPYRVSTSPLRYINPNGHQIISAGRNGLFGDSTLWTPAAGTTDSNGRDDQSNFSRAVLGSPQS